MATAEGSKSPAALASARLTKGLIFLLVLCIQLQWPQVLPVASEPIWLSTNQLNEDAEASNTSRENYAKLLELTQRNGPHMRASSDYKDFNDIYLNETLLAWRNLHQESKLFAENQVNLHRPKIDKLLKEANISQTCIESIRLTLDGIANLDYWAIRLWNSIGSFPPNAMLDGQLTDLGSFRGCVDLKVPENVASGASYCTVALRPVVPHRRRFHMIFEEEHSSLLNLFNKSDVFNELAHQAQYFHYLYLRTGICVTNECSALDIQKGVKLLAKRLSLMSGPVKCYSRKLTSSAENSVSLASSNLQGTANEPIQILLNAPMNTKQVISLTVISLFFGLMAVVSLSHLIVRIRCKALENSSSQKDQVNRRQSEGFKFETTHYVTQQLRKTLQVAPESEVCLTRCLHLDYFSAVTNAGEFFETSKRATNEIECLHGLRSLTMIWIICVHTLQYNEWSGFTRVFENVAALQNIALQPLYNANYVVDNFFLMSGLLVSYTAWYANNGAIANFSYSKSLLGRYLRLTPQVLLISLAYILLPLAGEGPFWYDMTYHEARNCEKNWWVNLLHIQSFYRKDEMCNLVGWWVSVDMFLYMVALGIVWLILKGQKKLAACMAAALTFTFTLVSACWHFRNGFPPNNLGVIPQVAEVWSSYVVDFFWSPLPHAYPFFFGLWLGYVMANSKWKHQVRRWQRLGWILATISLLTVNLSSHIWMAGIVKLGSQYISTSYNVICTITWATAFGWVIMACHYGTAPNLNKFLASKPFVLLSKASFIIYLSHMLVIRIFFGIQNMLLEVSVLTMIYIMVGNTVVSILFGVFLCITFEGPFMKFQKLIMRNLRRNSKNQSVIKQSISSKEDRDKVTIGIEMGAARTLLQ